VVATAAAMLFGGSAGCRRLRQTSRVHREERARPDYFPGQHCGRMNRDRVESAGADRAPPASGRQGLQGAAGPQERPAPLGLRISRLQGLTGPGDLRSGRTTRIFGPRWTPGAQGAQGRPVQADSWSSMRARKNGRMLFDSGDVLVRVAAPAAAQGAGTGPAAGEPGRLHAVRVSGLLLHGLGLQDHAIPDSGGDVLANGRQRKVRVVCKHLLRTRRDTHDCGPNLEWRLFRDLESGPDRRRAPGGHLRLSRHPSPCSRGAARGQGSKSPLSGSGRFGRSGRSTHGQVWHSAEANLSILGRGGAGTCPAVWVVVGSPDGRSAVPTSDRRRRRASSQRRTR